MVKKYLMLNTREQSQAINWGPDVAVDFESYYKKNEHDIDTLGGHAYNRHPKSYPFLVSVDDDEGHLWVGHPKDFDWTSLAGRRICAHNAAHDEDVYEAGVERGEFPRVAFKEWVCTADLSTYLCGHRNLQDAVKHLLGVDISKAVRTNADGKTWEEMLVEEVVQEDGSKTTFAQLMVTYAAGDGICVRIWKKYGHTWPEREKKISRRNREAGRKGVMIDIPELLRGIKLCQHVIAESTELLPWVKRGRKEGSPIGVAEECRASGIPCPPVKSGPKGDPEGADEWLELYAAKLPWVKALKDLRRGKKMLATLETMKSRLREDGSIPFSLLYAGTHTLRFAGVGGLNFLNFNKEPLFAEWDKEFGRGIDIRGLLRARPGKRFAIVDLSQIEPRCLNWAIGNEALLEQVRGGMALYEAFARTATGWKGGKLKNENKYGYALAKAQVLALGYAAGWLKFITMALMPQYGNLDLCIDDEKIAMQFSLDKKIYFEEEQERVGKDGKPETFFVPVEYDASKHGESEKVRRKRFIVRAAEDGGAPVRDNVYGINARKIVSEFRKNNPLIAGQDPENPGIWKKLDDALRESARKKEDFVINMPDGGTMTYRNCRMEKRRKLDKETGESYDRWEVRVDLGYGSTGTYGGKLTENFCQRFARDVFIEGILRCDDAGYEMVFNVYDEAILEVDDDGTPLGTKLEAPDESALGRCIALLSQTPDWAPGLPVAAEGLWTDRYAK